jgi:subtilisin family serine protease
MASKRRGPSGKTKRSKENTSSAQGPSGPGYAGPEEPRLETVESEALELDPHLQQIVVSRAEGRLIGRELLTETADGTPAVDVLAKLKDPAEPVDGLNVVEINGPFVTGTLDIDKIEQVRSHPNVLSLKRATRLHQELRFSVPEVRADAGALQAVSPSGAAADGSGVIIGIVDYGCDFLHRNFRKADGTTRLLYLWNQDGERTSRSPEPYGYGREFTAAQINTAIQQASSPPASTDPIYAQFKFPEDPNNRAYTALGYGPEPTPIQARGAGNHGTHVMDIAAGNGRGSGVPGMAPGADLIFVHASTGDVDPEESFGNSRRLVEAVGYIFGKAERLGRPCVINISLGTHGGPHDGSTLAELHFDEYLKQPGRAIVISAGNSWERRSHSAGRVTPTAPRTLTWQVGLLNQLGQLVDPTPNELEVWYPGSSALEVTVVTPAGQRVGPTALGRRTEIKLGGTVNGLVVNRRADSVNGDNHIDIFLSPALPTGNWQVVLTAPTGDVDFHAWIERDDRGQSRFAEQDDDRSYTLGSISCGERTLVVGSYDARAPQGDLSSFTAQGPTRDGKQKPEISAPGHAILAAWSLTHNRVTTMSGTSMAAPHVTGLVALIMQAAGRPLATAETRQIVGRAARVMSNEAWHPRYGAGRIDALASVRSSRATDGGNIAVQPDVASPTAVATTPALDDLFAALADAAAKCRARIRIEIEVQPAEV